MLRRNPRHRAGDRSVLYRLATEDGALRSVSRQLQAELAQVGGLPLQDAAFAPARAGGGVDQWFLLAPERRQHKVIAVVDGTTVAVDGGVGPGRGQVLDPLVLAHDARLGRLAVLGSRGLLQLVEAGQGPRRCVTRWGQFGLGPGQFLVTKPTVVAVDSEGRVHVADAGAPGPHPEPRAVSQARPAHRDPFSGRGADLERREGERC